MKKKIENELNILINEIKKSINQKQPFKKHIPNIITLLRLVFLPFIIYFILNNQLIIAGILTIIAVLTDTFDGFFARRFDAITNLGAKLDSIVDKIFTITILAVLVHINYFIIIAIILDLAIAFLNTFLILKGKIVKTIKMGRVKTIFLFMFISSLFFKEIAFINFLIAPLLIIVIILQISTLYLYYIIHQKS